MCVYIFSLARSQAPNSALRPRVRRAGGDELLIIILYSSCQKEFCKLPTVSPFLLRTCSTNYIRHEHGDDYT